MHAFEESIASENLAGSDERRGCHFPAVRGGLHRMGVGQGEGVRTNHPSLLHSPAGDPVCCVCNGSVPVMFLFGLCSCGAPEGVKSSVSRLLVEAVEQNKWAVEYTTEVLQIEASGRSRRKLRRVGACLAH